MKWSEPNFPKKGWKLIKVIDVREDNQPVEDTIYESCMMCNNERIRYVHVLSHIKVDIEFRVGCVCAEKMTNDYLTPKLKEEELKSIARKKANFFKRKWKETINGNFKMTFLEYDLLIFETLTGKFKCKINDRFGELEYITFYDAKLAIFKKVEYFNSKKQTLPK